MINDVISVESDDVVSIPGLTPSVILRELSVYENGEYVPESGVNGFSKVDVDVPGPVLVQLTATENNTYIPGTGEDGFSQVVVNVPAPPAPTIKNPYIEPEYFGLSYAYLIASGDLRWQPTDNNCINCYYLEAGTYVFFLDTPVGSRFRTGFFAGKTYDDFTSYISNPGPSGSTTVYTGVSETGGTELSGDYLNLRFFMTISEAGVLVIGTSNQSQLVKSFVFKITN